MRFSRASVSVGTTRAISIVSAVPLALGACSASVTTRPMLDTDKAEASIRAYLQEKAETVGEVTCPEREARTGDVFECTGIIDGQPIRMKLTQENNQGSVDMVQAQAIASVAKTVELIEKQVSEAVGFPVRADCGSQRVLVKDPGSTFECRVIDTRGGPDGTVVVTVKDIEANVDLRLV